MASASRGTGLRAAKITASNSAHPLAPARGFRQVHKNGIESVVKRALIWAAHDRASQTVEPEARSPRKLAHGAKFDEPIEQTPRAAVGEPCRFRGARRRNAIIGEQHLDDAPCAFGAQFRHDISVAYTYNDPTIFHEYAVDTAIACRALGVKNIAVTAGYVCPEPRATFYRHMDAVNIDLKGFTDDFYHKVCYAHLQPVLDTLIYVKRETTVWLEITTLLIPGLNNSDEEIEKMTQWGVENLGSDVPWHFTAFHPDWRMRDIPATPRETLARARRIAMKNGVRYAFTGNIHDPAGQSTYCHNCRTLLIERNGYEITTWRLSPDGKCDRLCRPMRWRVRPVAWSVGRKADADRSEHLRRTRTPNGRRY